MRRICLLIFVVWLASVAAPSQNQLDWSIGNGRDVDNILSQRRQAEIVNEYLSWRPDNILHG